MSNATVCPYRIAGASNKDGEPMLQVIDGTTCKTGMYDRNTSQDIGASIGPATTFFACVPNRGKPLSFQATVTHVDSIGPTGTVNLSHEAMSQWTRRAERAVLHRSWGANHLTRTDIGCWAVG